MPKLVVHNFAVSLDGYGSGLDQSLDNPIGVGGMRLHEWVFQTRSARQTHGMGEGGDSGIDDEFDHLDGGPSGYECVELVSSPSVAHVRLVKK